MTRHEILNERESPTIPIQEGALEWEDDKKYPVMSTGRWELIGWASDIKREDGVITANIDIHEKFQKGVEDLEDFMEYSPNTQIIEGDLNLVIRAKLMEIVLIMKPTYPRTD